MFGRDESETKLPKETRSAIEKLKAQAAELAARALTREPKLTKDEVSEVSSLQTRIAYLAPRKQKLLELLNAKDARLKFLERGNAQSMVIDRIEDLDALVAELVALLPAIKLLQSAYNTVSMELSQCESRIIDLKENARQREVKNER